jgi:hypothetical protein
MPMIGDDKLGSCNMLVYLLEALGVVDLEQGGRFYVQAVDRYIGR